MLAKNGMAQEKTENRGRGNRGGAKSPEEEGKTQKAVVVRDIE